MKKWTQEELDEFLRDGTDIYSSKPPITGDISGLHVRDVSCAYTRFGSANESLLARGTSFDGAWLRSSCFYAVDLSDTTFRHTMLRGARFEACLLRNADFSEVDGLHFTHFPSSNLEGAKFPSNLSVPRIENIDRAVYTATTQPGCGLGMGDWHQPCGTVHCWAGWVTTLAGPAGARLEHMLGTDAAASLIYAASGSHPVPNWYMRDDDEALELMKERAGL